MSLFRPSARACECRRTAVLAVVVIATVLVALHAGAQDRRYTIAVANLTEEPGATLEGTGFTGREIRDSFMLAARGLPVDLVLYDNRGDVRTALENAADAARRRVDLFVEYFNEPSANDAIARTLRDAHIPVLAVNYPVGDAPIYTADNAAAGRIGGEALADFAARSWRGVNVVGVIVGPVAARQDRLAERVRGVTEGLRGRQPPLRIVQLDTQGNPSTVAALLGKLLAAQPSTKFVIAALDDATALAAKSALELAGRLTDGAIVGFGCDRSIHGGANDRKEIDPSNRGSIVVGSVGFYLDRYGYDVLPLALRMLRGEPVPARSATRHTLITAANVFKEYPPYDMQ